MARFLLNGFAATTILLSACIVVSGHDSVHAFQGPSCVSRYNNTARTPAVLEIENRCYSRTLTVCIEFDGEYYAVENVHAGQLRRYETAYGDCWVLRQGSCSSGRIMVQWSISASATKLSLGCAPMCSMEYEYAVAKSKQLECILTKLPSIWDVHNALGPSIESLPVDMEVINNQLGSASMVFANTTEFLTTSYDRLHHLLMLGCDVQKSASVFAHARALVAHISLCNPQLLTSNSEMLYMPISYQSLYGFHAGSLIARARHFGTLRPARSLTAEEMESLDAKRQEAISLPMHAEFTTSLIPGRDEGVDDSRSIYLEQPDATRFQLVDIGLSRNISSRVLNLRGQALCDNPDNDDPSPKDKYKFYKLTSSMSPDTYFDCCSIYCSLVAEMSRDALFAAAQETDCCLKCNRHSCALPSITMTTAVTLLAEIQLQAKNETSEPTVYTIEV